MRIRTNPVSNPLSRLLPALVAFAAAVGILGAFWPAGAATAAAVSGAAALAAFLVLGRKVSFFSGAAETDEPDLPARLLEVQEAERRKLSRELHDGVGQTLTALKMELSRIRANYDGPEAERLDRAVVLSNDVLQAIRNVSLLLRPTALDDLGLDAALQWQVEDFSRRTSIPCTLNYSVENQEFLPDPIKTCVFRVVQEALNNCEKHANPSAVEIHVLRSTGELLIRVSDDGQGAASLSGRNRGLGILGMRERAASLGGALELVSKPGQGTSVAVRLPIGHKDGPASTDMEIE